MKHTPGTWEALENGQVWGPNPHEDGDILICDTAPNGVALTEYDADNARLIAAAPDLLAALQQFVSIYPDKARNHPDVRIALTAAEDAIRKATGD